MAVATQTSGSAQLQTGAIAAYETARRQRFKSTATFAQTTQLAGVAPATIAMPQPIAIVVAAASGSAFGATTAGCWSLWATDEGAVCAVARVTWVGMTLGRSLIRKNVGRLRGHVRRNRTLQWKYKDSSQSFA